MRRCIHDRTEKQKCRKCDEMDATSFVALNRLMEMAIKDFCRVLLPLLCEDCRLHIPAVIRKEIEEPALIVGH